MHNTFSSMRSCSFARPSVRQIAREFRAQCEKSPNFYNVGDKITNPRAFTNPIGIHFPAGSVFTVVLGGEPAGRSIKLVSDQCGAVVWISDGLFLARDY